MMASIVFGSIIQVWPFLPYEIRYMEVSTSVGGRTKCTGQPAGRNLPPLL